MKSRFSKEPKEGYAPIFANGVFTNVNLEHNVNSMKNLEGFCSCNNLPSGRIAKMQGGYYILNNDLEWERVARTLQFFPFHQLLSKMSKLK